MQELLAIVPEVRKQIKELIQTKRLTSSGSAFNMITASAEASGTLKHHNQGQTLPDRNDGLVVAKHVEDLHATEVLLEGRITVEALMDDGCQIVALQRNLWERLGLPIRSDHQMQMVSANATTSQTVGLLHNLKITIGGYEFYLQVQVVDDAPYEMLLGRTLLTLTQASIQHFSNGDSHITLIDPNTCTVITVPTRTRKAKETATNSVLTGIDESAGGQGDPNRERKEPSVSGTLRQGEDDRLQAVLDTEDEDEEGDNGWEDDANHQEPMNSIECGLADDLFKEGSIGDEGIYDDMPGMQTVSDTEDEGDGGDDEEEDDYDYWEPIQALEPVVACAGISEPGDEGLDERLLFLLTELHHDHLRDLSYTEYEELKSFIQTMAVRLLRNHGNITKAKVKHLKIELDRLILAKSVAQAFGRLC
ncbi:LOW QUALITY PROTEIN: hypothetical protein CVT25_003315 [Psilocybe cyanescens]|uniref:Aspartic peptidase DDI1-type domain-containing protein n=1 Tax=Psilocybe cyanescens TaxID=93625 RepID=A0A409WME6_PSICY|nr:LOW QUALITY PROTEIN: hypothetical protein CVT25_003315 [Psilocybe cyanescens]